VHRRPNRDLESSRTDVSERHRDGGSVERRGDVGDFWRGIGVDVDGMSPGAQLTTSLALLVPVVGGYLAALLLAPWLWWLVFFLIWAVPPVVGLMLRSVAGLSEGQHGRLDPGSAGERELLTALRERGELTPAQAAMETSLTVAEADQMLGELAGGGHLDVRVRGGGLFYALWEPEEDASRGL
jgi:hypothetical protein